MPGTSPSTVSENNPSQAAVTIPTGLNPDDYMKRKLGNKPGQAIPKPTRKERASQAKGVVPDKSSAPAITPDQYMANRSSAAPAAAPAAVSATPSTAQKVSPPPGIRQEDMDIVTEARNKISAVIGDRDPSILQSFSFSKLPIYDRFQILAIAGEAYAKMQYRKGKEAKTTWDKIKSYYGAFGGGTIDYMNTIMAGITEPKNVGIMSGGTTAAMLGVPYAGAAVGAYYFLTGAARLPGDAREAIKDPSYDNIKAVFMSGLQTAGTAGGLAEGTFDVKMGKGGIEGRGLTEKFMQGQAKTTPAYTEELIKKADERYTKSFNQVTDNYKAKVEDIKRKYAEDVGAREKAQAEADAEYVKHLADEGEKYGRELAQVEHAREGEAMVEMHRRKLQLQERELVGSTLSNVKNTGELIGKDFDQRWDQSREIAGKDWRSDPVATKELIEEARSSLHGVPADLALFNQIMQELEATHDAGGDVVSTAGGEPLKAQDWGGMRDQFSALGKAMYGRELSGNVYNALKLVRDGYRPGENANAPNVVQDPRSFDAQLTRRMESKGAGPLYKQLKSDYSRYMSDWHDTRNIPGGNGPRSPLARLYLSEDPASAIRHLTGNFTDRLIEQFGRYSKFGAAPSVIQTFRDNNFELTHLPKPKYTPLPEKPAALPGTTKVAPERAGKDVAPVELPDKALSEAERRYKRNLHRLESVKIYKLGKAFREGDYSTMLDLLKEAKEARAKAAADRITTIGRHDAIMASLFATGMYGAGLLQNGHLGYALLYVPFRAGEMAMINSRWAGSIMSRVGPKDIEAINKMYEKDPSMKPEGQKVITDVLLGMARKGEAIALKTFSTFLTPEQVESIRNELVSRDMKAKAGEKFGPGQAGGTGEPPTTPPTAGGPTVPPNTPAPPASPAPAGAVMSYGPESEMEMERHRGPGQAPTATDESSLKSAVEKGGGIFRGIQEGVPESGIQKQVLFNSPKTGSTLSLPIDEATPENIRRKIAEHEAKYKTNQGAEGAPRGSLPRDEASIEPGSVGYRGPGILDDLNRIRSS